jgi:hypothetical protein
LKLPPLATTDTIENPTRTKVAIKKVAKAVKIGAGIGKRQFLSGF